MAKRPHPRRATRNPADGPWTTCDRCGFVTSMNRMQFQYDFTGGSVPTNLGVLVCPICLDDLQYQFKLLVLPPDPKPYFNTRPENYVVDETNWLTTQDGGILTTQSGSPLISSIPNPSDKAFTSVVSSILSATSISPPLDQSILYLDLFLGDPNTNGFSVLEAITGSSVRTNIAPQMALSIGDTPGDTNLLVNPDVITVTTSCRSTVNVSYAAIYDATSGGNLLITAPMSATIPTMTPGASVQFDQLGLQILL